MSGVHGRRQAIHLAGRKRPFKAWMGRTFPWYSSRRSDFSYDFHASFDDFLDLTLLGPAGTWEEPKGRATAFRTGARDTLRYHDECDD